MPETDLDDDTSGRHSPPGPTTILLPNSQAARFRPRFTPTSRKCSAGELGGTFAELPRGSRPIARRMMLPLRNSLRTHSARSSISTVSQTLHACEPCRKAKARCSGDQPCQRCQTYSHQCAYQDGKRDKEKREREQVMQEKESTKHRIEELELLLHRISMSSQLDSSEKESIISVLATNDSKGSAAGIPSDRSALRISPGNEADGENLASGDVGSTESLDIIHENVDHDESSRSTGFLGKGSEISWIQRAKTQATKNLMNGETDDSSSDGDISLAQVNYHLTNADTATIDKSQVDPFEWPTPLVALTYITSYFNTIHSAFPIVDKNGFIEAFNQFPHNRISSLSYNDRHWLSQINIVFAISAKLAYLTKAEYQGREFDHLTFYARAKAFGLEHQKLTERPELDRVSSVGLLGLYLFVDHQINSSWTAIGSSMRSATALGLHLRNDVKDISVLDKELRVRVWWSLYSLERLLCECTGRPSCISDYDISTPLPLNIDEKELRHGFQIHERHYAEVFFRPSALKPASEINLDPSQVSDGSAVPTNNPSSVLDGLPVNSSTYFIHQTLLSMITHEVLTRLYCASTAKTRWIDVQNSIRGINSKLLAWIHNLPPELDFLTQIESTKYELERMGLAMQYSSTRMILHRSCLCRFEGRIQHESKKSQEFNRSAARTCVESAQDIIRYLPDLPDPPKAYCNTPWWSLLHYLCQAAAVLMLEITFRAEHAPTRAYEILRDAKKAVSWLRSMSIESRAARKSWGIFDTLLREVAPKIGGDTAEMPREAPMPSSWANSMEQHYYGTYTSGVDQGLYFAVQESQSYLASNAPIETREDEINSESWNFLHSSCGIQEDYIHYDQQFPGLPPFYTMYDEFRS